MVEPIAPPRVPLRRIRQKGWLGGVCAGVGYWLGVPTWIVRLAWTLSILLMGFGLLLYVLLWIFMPAWDPVPADYDARAAG